MRTLTLALISALASVFIATSAVGAIGGAKSELASEYSDTANQIAEAFSSRSGETVAELLDMNQVIEQSTKGMDLKRSETKQLVKIFNAAKGQLAESLTKPIPDGALVKLLRSRPHSSGAQALIRIDMGDHGFGYRNFILGKDKDRVVRIIDWYDYSSGQFYTDTIRQSLASILPSKNVYKRVFSKITGDQTQQQYSALLATIGKHDYQTFFAVFDEADAEIRESRLALILAFNMANMSGDEERYFAVLTMLDEHHGDDEDLQLMLYDHYLTEGQYDKAVDALVSTSRHMGIRDAVNYVLTAVVFNESGDTLKSIEAGEKAVELEPEVELAYWALLTSYAKAKRYNDAIKTMKTLENDFGYLIDAEALSTDQIYIDLLASDAFKSWEASK